FSLMTATPHHTRTALGHIHEYISGQGFYFSKQEVANFFLALKSKPFVILAGISGTGKSQLPRLLASALGHADKVRLIPVRPDWTDDSDLLGYEDLNGGFQMQAFLQVIFEAIANPSEPYFVILDEMNLARVEYYFSTYLSLLETRHRQEEKIITEPIFSGPLRERHQALREAHIPDNLYLIGTVNMDETTQAFSRKVLDRANAIEMNDIQLDWPQTNEVVAPLEEVYNDLLRSRYLHARDISEEQRAQLRPALLRLMEINEILSGADLQFGYRVRDEIAFYLLARYEISELLTEREALDYQILQKILVRIQGSSRRLGRCLRELIQYLGPKALRISERESATDLIEQIGDPQKAGIPFPRSLAKLLLMYRRYEEDGFTSFWL
ncbi:MAG: AAA family ATPase, partial [Bacteroidota bacterium]